VQGAKAFYNKWVRERQGVADRSICDVNPLIKLAQRIILREYLQPKYPP